MNYMGIEQDTIRFYSKKHKDCYKIPNGYDFVYFPTFGRTPGNPEFLKLNPGYGANLYLANSGFNTY